jgi:hypothetical protein
VEVNLHYPGADSRYKSATEFLIAKLRPATGTADKGKTD